VAVARASAKAATIKTANAAAAKTAFNLRWLIAAFVVLLVITFMLVGGNTGSRSSGGGRAARTPDGQLQAILNSAAEWGTASQQDGNPVMKMLHASYALAYLHIARNLASDATIERVCSVRMDEFMRMLEATQSAGIQALTTVCPAVAPTGILAANTGWLIT
jgi:hypothetical protein